MTLLQNSTQLLKNNKHYFKWVLTNGLYAALLYYGLIMNVNGALNVALFVSWILGVVGTIALISESVRKETIKRFLDQETKFVPRAFNILFDLGALGLFIWEGYMVLPIVLFLSFLGEHILVNEYNEWEHKNLKELLQGNMIDR